MNIKSQGESTKKLCNVALPISNRLKLFSKKNRNNAEIILKAAMMIHALQFPKKFQSSFLNIAIINGFVEFECIRILWVSFCYFCQAEVLEALFLFC